MLNTGSPGGDAGPLRAGVSRWRRWALVTTLTLIAAAAATMPFWRRPAPPPPTAAAEEDADLDELATRPQASGYLGPQACTPCHAERVAEFQATSHFRACRLPRVGEMPPGFAPGRGHCATRDPALRFDMTRAGDDFLQTTLHTTAAGERRTSTRIDLVYGAAAADEVYFSWHGDHLRELPLAWLHPQNQWGMAPYYRYGTGDFSRKATTRCLECHNTYFEHVPGTANQYRRDSFLLGVSCERCHGPGRDHAAFHQAHPQAGAAHAVVHPGRLTRVRQLEVCTQCHSNAIKRRRPAFSYRPGTPLADSFRTIVTRHPEDDHVANQIQYLRASRCFQKTDLTCTTCHNPHRGHETAAPGLAARSCLKCHQAGACAEHNRLPAPVRGNCVGCHMPARVWMNVHFQTEDDLYVPPIRRHEHRIAVYPVARQEVLLAWYRTQVDAPSRQEAARLTKALVGHWLAEADNRCRAYRFMAAIGAIREALRLDPAPATHAKLKAVVAIQARLDADLVEANRHLEGGRPAKAIETLDKILAVKPDWATAHGKLGMAYASTGASERAAKHLRAVADCDPNDAYGYAMLGWLAFLQDKAADAEEAYRRADELEPFSAKLKYQRGLALRKLGRLKEAIECFRRGLTIDPNHGGICQALSDALRHQGQAAEAVRFGRRAARLTRFQNPDVLVTLAEAYAAAGRFADADATATRALTVARTGNPELVPHIRRSLEGFRARGQSAPK